MEVGWEEELEVCLEATVTSAASLLEVVHHVEAVNSKVILLISAANDPAL